MSNFKIGDAVELNNKTYIIVGTIARSFLVEDTNGKRFKVTANMINRITGSPAAQPAQRREARDTTASDEAALAERVRYAQLFDKSAHLPTTEEEIFKAFDSLSGELSPENLSCDGECSQSEVARRRANIKAAWRALEKRLGRKVSESEIEAKQWARYQASRASK
jgi:hypothetical protein